MDHAFNFSTLRNGSKRVHCVGCTVDVFASGPTLLSSHTVDSNDETTITLETSRAAGTPTHVILRAYGAPSPHPEVSGRQCLLADNWLGIMESVTFPNLSQEVKQLNLGLGGNPPLPISNLCLPPQKE